MLPINILLIDDRRENLMALEVVLQSPRYGLIRAFSGAEALKILDTTDISIILLDVQMPEMDGFETARRIKANPVLRNIPIIFITAMSNDPVFVFKGYDSGGIDYLTKPLDDHLLKSKVSVLADLAQANRELKKEIRERERAEAALRLSQLELEQRVKDRTSSLVTANDALQREIVERARMQEKLQASLQEKEVLLKEIHHRVKNNLQIISSLLNLQSDTIRDPSLSELFRESQNRIRSMALVHEELYGTKELSTIEMSSYVRSLTSQLLQSAGRLDIRTRLKAEGISLNLNRAIPCGLILNELVSNALKHAFPNGRSGEISVIFQRLHEEGMLMLTVKDNGVGLKELEVSGARSLGLRLVSLLTEQLGGTCRVERIETGGTLFNVLFPEMEIAVAKGFFAPSGLPSPSPVQSSAA